MKQDLDDKICIIFFVLSSKSRLTHSFHIHNLGTFDIYVMQPSEMSLMSGPNKFQFFTLFGKVIRVLCFAENPIKIRLQVSKI